jgi:hypothetical protein
MLPTDGRACDRARPLSAGSRGKVGAPWLQAAPQGEKTMTNSQTRISAILLATAIVTAAPLTADAFPARAGGGGGGGGGGHPGGGGGGGFHPGGGGGGVPHFGGGGGVPTGAMHLGNPGARFVGPRPGGPMPHGMPTVTRTFPTAHPTGVMRTVPNTALRPGAPHAFGGPALAHAGWHRGHEFRRFRGLFGWYGPLFWPYAYDDIYDDVFWGYGYGAPFWDYGYSDIYGGMFSPFGYDDLAGYAPVGPSPERVRRGRSGAAASLPAENLSGLAGGVAQMCGEDTREVAGWPIDRITQLIAPSEDQRTALDELASASVKAAQVIKAACPTAVALTPTGRMAAMQQRIEAMAQAVDTVRGPIENLYGMLIDEQKAQLTAASRAPDPQQARGSLTQNCSAANAATQWPGAQIEKAVRPTEAQQPKLTALQSAAAEAAEQLAGCPSELPATPPARLAAVAKRLDVMLQAVKNVRAALDDFYGTLSDEQKAQFNVIGQPRTAQR